MFEVGNVVQAVADRLEEQVQLVVVVGGAKEGYQGLEWMAAEGYPVLDLQDKKSLNFRLQLHLIVFSRGCKTRSCDGKMIKDIQGQQLQIKSCTVL